MTNSANPATGVAQAAGAPVGPDEKAYYCAIRECDKKKLTQAQTKRRSRSRTSRARPWAASSTSLRRQGQDEEASGLQE